MSIVNRQNNLFAAEDWKVAYKAFSEVDFKAYDFDTMRTALVEYIRTNFPENFNDYIESSEFIAIIELLAFLSTSIAFRMDVNSRENFLETAERRDSVFKLARMLGYNPKRNVPASGLMKLSAVSTTESLTDSQGNELSNQRIFWDDSNNPDSYEQFITVLNSAMSTTNRFTSPVKSGKVAGINTDEYRINTLVTSPISYGFNLNVNGVNRNFEIVNGDFRDNEFFFEKEPDPTNDFSLFYRNDGLGLSSSNTGFFLLFKQGKLNFAEFNYETPIQNRNEDITVQNINETDVFVQEITTTGAVINKWTKIPNTIGQTLNYNSQSLGTRNLYSVENIDNDGIRIKYPDGSFGNVPTGIYRVWYRVSDGERYTIQPDDATNITVSIPYQNGNGEDHRLSLTFGLESSVGNSLPAESLASIKQRAPQTFYTQNRMVSAQDYQVFPLSQTSNILKLKATNKTHAGHSRYIDISDPTGTYQSVETYAEDGYLYRDDDPISKSIIINDNNTSAEVVDNVILNYLKEQKLNNTIYDTLRGKWNDYIPTKFKTDTLNIRWKPLPVATQSTTGYMTETFSTSNTVVMINNTSSTKVFQENTFVKFVNPDNVGEYKWVRITGVTSNGALSSGLSTSIGPWTLSASVNDGWRADEVVVSLRKSFTSSEQSAIVTALDNKRTFGLGFDLTAQEWYVIENENLLKTGSLDVVSARDTSSNQIDNSWLLKFEFSPIDNTSYRYTVSIRGLSYVVQSRTDLKFYNIKNVKVTDSTTRAKQDQIIFNTLNYKPGVTETFVWADSDSDSVGDAWQSLDNATFYDPIGLSTNIALRTRDIKWFDINVKWQSNFGLLRNDTLSASNVSVANIATVNRFVNDANTTLNTYFNDGVSATSNVTISNNEGRISKLPSNITLNFTNTTFGYNIITPDSANASLGNITYKAYNSSTGLVEIYHGRTNDAYSYGVSGTTVPVAHGGGGANYQGSLQIISSNTTAETGTIVYDDVSNNQYLFATDTTGAISRDKIIVEYKQAKDRLDEDLVYTISDVFKYADGYTDNRKVKVAPVDSDGDLVPDKPFQFNEFVSVDDLIIFENYTDFDGYTYDRPIKGVIIDYRGDDVDLSAASGNPGTISPISYSDPVEWSTIDYIIVDTLVIAEKFNNTATQFSGIHIYVAENEKFYTLTPSSTDATNIQLVEDTNYFVKEGRGASQNTRDVEERPCIIKWDHNAPNDIRIDPSISNIVEMQVLTASYYAEIQKYLKVPGTEFPVPPTSGELSNEFTKLNEFKGASDTIVYKSAKFRRLFGTDSDDDVQAKFKVVKLSGTTLSDNEIKTKIIQAFNNYFDVSNWEFGENFYFTELSSYVHQQLSGIIGSIVICPKNTSGIFGDLFQIKAESNELLISTAKVTDIEIIDKITNTTLSNY